MEGIFKISWSGLLWVSLFLLLVVVVLRYANHSLDFIAFTFLNCFLDNANMLVESLCKIIRRSVSCISTFDKVFPCCCAKLLKTRRKVAMIVLIALQKLEVGGRRTAAGNSLEEGLSATTTD